MDPASTSSSHGLPTGIPLGPATDPQPAQQDLTIDQLLIQVNELNEQNEALVSAVFSSAEIIEELEETKRQLADAQSETEKAHEDTRKLVDTIFQGSRDAMIVLDSQYKIVSANQTARSLFELDQSIADSSIVQDLTKQYFSEDYADWFSALISANEVGHRLELYRESSPDEIESEHGSARHWIELSINVLGCELERVEFLLTANDITRRKKVEAQFQHQAFHDNVTGLPNRRYFVQKIEEIVDRGEQKSFTVCFLDLDNFKSVNDTLGHDAGDQLLVQVANRIKSVIRRDSLLARFGGDEFALLIPDLDVDKVKFIGQRVVMELKRPFQINDSPVYIGASVGMTRFPIDATDVNGLLQNADVAMYSAKEGGRSRFHAFTPELAAGIQERQSLLDDLREALDRKEIGLEYQPKWCLKENRIAGSEALLRWRRHNQVVSAAHLVDAAECSGLILPLGYFVIEMAVKQHMVWQEEISLDGKIAINISPRQLVDPNFVDRFVEIVESAGASPEIVELEITETAMIRNFDQAFEQIRKLNQTGASIAIDDFGTGYSSLSYLKSFPVSTLKIDQSFVKDLPHDPKAVAVARAILSLGHGLGLKVVAEGVETEQQCEFLKEAGCDLVQGYFFSRSLGVEAFGKWATSFGHPMA